MSLAVDEPILNNLFEEPKGYRLYEERQPKKMSELVRLSDWRAH